MPARRAPRRSRRPGRAPCESSSSFASRFDFERVLGTPFQAHPPPFGLERLLRGGLEVLLDDAELAPGVELDDVAREHADVDDLADPARLAGSIRLALLALVQHVDLLRPDRELPSAPVEHVRDADEAGDE